MIGGDGSSGGGGGTLVVMKMEVNVVLMTVYISGDDSCSGSGRGGIHKWW